MTTENVIWLASYPRSGNTLLRTVLWNCFGLRSGSIYPNDLSNNAALEARVGHIEQGPDKKITFPHNNPPLVKTHEPPSGDGAAIYVVRDGRAASMSLWHFYDHQLPLEAIISGKHRFGTWSNHIALWQPLTRPNTLLIKYEDITANLPGVLNELSKFLGRSALRNTIPSREDMVSVDGRWVREKSDWKSQFSKSQLALFNDINGEMLQTLEYSS